MIEDTDIEGPEVPDASRRGASLRSGSATIQDVARAAGVSTSTVSNVINDQPHVKDATRAKVVSAMERLDYRVNVAARNLRAGRTGTIGLGVPEIDRPYFGNLAARIISAAAKHRLNVVIEQTGATRESELKALALSRNRFYDGLILSTVRLAREDVDKLALEHPVVILGEQISNGPLDHVALPNAAGAQAAVEHLLERGCRRIAIIDSGHTVEDDGPDVSSLRRSGYRDALASAGIAFDPDLAVSIQEFTMQDGHDAIRRLVHRGIEFDGVFCVTDTVAMGALRALATAGIHVPDAVKVIGFDDVPESAFLVPSLTSVAPDHAFTAEIALDMLVARLRGGGATAMPPREATSPFTILTRESTR